MARNLEQDLEIGRAVKEMTETRGWQILAERIKQEIEDERIAFKGVDNKAAFDRLVEYMEHQKVMEGLERVFGFVKDYLRDKEDAENKLRK